MPHKFPLLSCNLWTSATADWI